MPCVFISYAHENDTFRGQVKALADWLSEQGCDVLTDHAYCHRPPPEGWQAWMHGCIRKADVVLVVGSPKYRERYEKTAPLGAGRGVTYEGAILTQEIYNAFMRNVKYYPILPVGGEYDDIPIMLQSWWNNHFFPTGNSGILALAHECAASVTCESASAVSSQVGVMTAITPVTTELPVPSFPQDAEVDISHLPAGAEYFFGREEELALLDAAWADSGRSRVVELVAPGGTGKSSLIRRWLENMKQDGWRGANRVFAWSFYSQGTSHERQASDDAFLSAALAWFKVDIDPASHPWDKGQRLAEAVAAGRTLLILDGVEPLQHPSGGPLAGELRVSGLKALLEHLTSAGQAGLCVITSRERIADLAQYERNASRPDGAVLRRQLENLNEHDGARLLHVLGANKAGAASVADDDEELKTASREVRGHALTLSLLGRYVALAYQGDIRQRAQVDFQEADNELDDGHAFKVIEAYEHWFASAGERGARTLAALRLLGFFDYPADLKSLCALRQPPALPEVSRPLENLKPAHWQATLQRLVDCGLAFYNEDKTTLDSHPLVREYQAKVLQSRFRPAWLAGNKLLYEYLKKSTSYRPDDLAGLQPLYQAVVHGCRAGLHQDVLDKVYRDRILRGTGPAGAYSIKKLGAFDADLGAATCFFNEPWRSLAPDMSESDKAWLLIAAAFRLRAVGRLIEALEPMQIGVEMQVSQEDWQNVSIGYNNLSELRLSLGQIDDALMDAKKSVAYADKFAQSGGDVFYQMMFRTTLADALHQQGKWDMACQDFKNAEVMHIKHHPDNPLLYSLWGFRYCDLLLAGAERAASRGAKEGEESKICVQIAKRAAQTLVWAEADNMAQLSLALDHLTLARCALYVDMLRGVPSSENALYQIEAAVTGLRHASDQVYLPLGLLTRAWLYHNLGKIEHATADLNEAQRIAERGGMKLHLADIALTRARLFKDRAELAKARALIEECGYWRRKEELEDAEARL